MKKALSAALLLALLGGGAMAQSQAPAPAAPVSAPAPADAGAIKSQNIFEVKPDASAEPGYATQTNAERARVQPGNNAPMWRQVGSGVSGYSSLPKSEAPEAGNLIQPFVQYPGSRLTNAGEAWRQVRNNWIIPYGGSLIVIIVLAIALFYWRRGPMGGHIPDTGRKIERFTPFERATHWSVAISFVILAVSGIVMAFGKFFLLPVMGASLFGWLSYALKTLHNFAGPLFAVALVIFIFTYLRDNFPRAGDMNWLKKGGGFLGGEEIPSGRFNAGEKIVFWGGVILLGVVVVASGLVLDKLVPGFGDTRGQMQVAHIVHAVASVLMMAMFCGHIYMGTIGISGAYQAMRTGYVDEAWAKEHHELWYDDIKAGRVPAQRSAGAAPAGTLATPAGHA